MRSDRNFLPESVFIASDAGGKPLYQLLVFYPRETSPRHRLDTRTAVETSMRLPLLLAEHSECERIVGMFGTIQLFAVDSAGNKVG